MLKDRFSFKEVVLFVALISAFFAYGQEMKFYSRQFGSEDGLPSTEVYEILQDQEGFIWFSTDAGVSRFDGYEFQNFLIEDGLVDNTVFHMYEDVFGRVWFLSYTNQLCYYQKGEIHPYEYNSLLKEVLTPEWIRRIEIDADNQLHFVGRRFGYGSITAEGEFIYKLDSPSEAGRLECVYVDNKQLYYGLRATNSDSIVDYAGHLRSRLAYSSATTYQFSMFQKELSPDNHLIGLGGLVCLLSGDTVKQQKKTDCVIQSAFIQDDGVLWLAFFNRGIEIYQSTDAFFNGDSPIAIILSEKNVSHIYGDKNGAVWLAIQNGGCQYIPNPKVWIYNLSDNDLNNRVSSIHLTQKGDVYAGTFSSNVYKITEGSDATLYQETMIPGHVTIYNLGIDEGNNDQVYLKRSISISDGSKYIIGTNRGIIHVKNNDTLFIKSEGQDYQRFNCVFKDSTDRMWLGSNRGLFELYDNQLKQNETFESIGSYGVIDIDQLDSRTLIIATKGTGLVFIRGKELQIVDKSLGLCSNVLRDVDVDQHGNIWLASPEGLNIIRDPFEKNRKLLTLNECHGLQSREINQIKTTADGAWIATNDGVARIKNKDVGLNTLSPTVSIREIKINELQEPIKNDYSLRSNENFIEINYSAISFRNAPNILYRYRLKGIENQWIYTYDRSVRYVALQSGEYQFELQAANEDQVWSDSVRISFNISKPFWKELWFIVSVGLLILFILIVIFGYRERREKQKVQERMILEQEKLARLRSELKALRAQMNPHFIFNTLSAIRSSIRNSGTDQAEDYITNFAKLIRKVLEHSKSSRLKLDQEIEMLQLYIELEQLRFSNKFDFKFHLDENIQADFFEIPSMVLQPFVENAIIHGLAPKKGNGTLNISFSIAEDHLYCVIEDNGIGREAAKAIKLSTKLHDKSMALDITQDRMSLLKKASGKDFDLNIVDLKQTDGTAAGTRVELTIPV